MADRPNVLFIVVDDLRPELGCYGSHGALSPNIDRLAAEGVLFEQAYCQQAVCAPSRASVLTGLRPDSTGIHDLQTPVSDALPDVLTLPQHFKDNGYQTVSIGKVYHHAQDDIGAWTTPPTQSRGDWKGRGYLTDEAVEAMRVQERELLARGDRRRGIGPAFEAADVPDDAYHDGKDADAAIRELARLKGDPFFMALGFHKPHLPFNAPKRYWDMYGPEDIALAENDAPPEGVTPFSLTNFGELRGYFGIPAEGPVPDDIARKLVHGYRACVSYMDAQVGRVLDAVEELGLTDDTVVMLWGDHGWKLGEHGSWCKHTNFEIDTRAPLIVRAPERQAPGHRTSALVEFVDMYPTLCDLCGISTPSHLEGTSFAPLLNDSNGAWKTAAFSQYPRRRVMGYTVKTARYRYTEWQDKRGGGVRARELYDHRKDAAENANVAEHADYADAVARMSVVLAQGWRATTPAP
jgi:arylsulfatase A-like enzyme